MAKRGMNERIQRLREQSVTTPVHIDLERAKIETDFYKENDFRQTVKEKAGKLCDHRILADRQCWKAL